MTSERRKQKGTSIAGKSIRGLVILGVVLLVGVSTAAGISLYRENMDIYREMAFAQTRMIYGKLTSATVQKYIDRREELVRYYDKYKTEVESGLSPTEEGLSPDDEAAAELFGEWADNKSFFMLSVALSNDLKRYYVAIPEEDDMVLIWDSDQTDGVEPFEHKAYRPREKEYLLAAEQGEYYYELVIYREDSEIIGTAMQAIYNTDTGDAMAVVAVDISITDIRNAFLGLFLRIAIAITLIMLVTVTVYFSIMRKQIINPIVTLEKATGDIVEELKKETSLKVDIHTGDEIEALARSFEDMDSRLRLYISENAAITAERERIGTELALAKSIQANMLPNEFPPFPDKKEFDIYASMKPAKEVGGDFYDFFLVDENHLCLIIADVSGKGVPAALFMMMCKIMLQNYAMSGLTPKEVIETVNTQICKNNRDEMFITVWLGILDLTDGVMKAVNAGHEFPILQRAGDGFTLMKDTHSFVVGGMEEVRYREYEFVMQPGSKLFLYTDGLTEAADANENLFGIEQVLQVLNESACDEPKKILETVDQEVSRFAADEPQSDDLTMLCLVYYGNLGKEEAVL